MKQRIRQQEQELKHEVYQCQEERGLRALTRLMEYQRATALTNLRQARTIEEFVRWQTTYNEAQTTIDTITTAPRTFNDVD